LIFSWLTHQIQSPQIWVVNDILKYVDSSAIAFKDTTLLRWLSW
jgi:hypothetical protein